MTRQGDEKSRKKRVALIGIGACFVLGVVSAIPGLNVALIPLALKGIAAIVVTYVGGQAWADGKAVGNG